MNLLNISPLHLSRDVAKEVARGFELRNDADCFEALWEVANEARAVRKENLKSGELDREIAAGGRRRRGDACRGADGAICRWCPSRQLRRSLQRRLARYPTDLKPEYRPMSISKSNRKPSRRIWVSAIAPSDCSPGVNLDLRGEKTYECHTNQRRDSEAKSGRENRNLQMDRSRSGG